MLPLSLGWKAIILNRKTKPCLVACSVLKKEITKLIENDELDAEVVFISQLFHEDLNRLEKNLRLTIEQTLQHNNRNVILVYGDFCLGLQGQMKKIVDEFKIIKIDALNCVDCLLGGKGKYLEVDPNQELIFLSQGMMNVFKHLKRLMKKEGFNEEDMSKIFKNAKGIVALDSLGNYSRLIEEINKQDTGLKILRTINVGCENVRQVIQESIEKIKK